MCDNLWMHLHMLSIKNCVCSIRININIVNSGNCNNDMIKVIYCIVEIYSDILYNILYSRVNIRNISIII